MVPVFLFGPTTAYGRRQSHSFFKIQSPKSMILPNI